METFAWLKCTGKFRNHDNKWVYAKKNKSCTLSKFKIKLHFPTMSWDSSQVGIGNWYSVLP